MNRMLEHHNKELVSSEKVVSSPRELYKELQQQIRVGLFIPINPSVAATGEAVTMHVPGIPETTLVTRWKKDATSVKFRPTEMYVPQAYPFHQKDIDTARLVKKECKAVVDFVTEAVILDAKANVLRTHGHGTDKLVAEKLSLMADKAFFQAHLAQLGIKMNTKGLDWLERSDSSKAQLFWSSLFEQVEQMNQAGESLTVESLNSAINELREELEIADHAYLQEGVRPSDYISTPFNKKTIHLGVPMVAPFTASYAAISAQAKASSLEYGRSTIYYSMVLVTLASVFAGAISACGPSSQPEEQPSPTEMAEVTEEVLGTATATLEPIVGVVNTPTGEPASEAVASPTADSDSEIATGWGPPSLEQAQAGSGGAISQDIQDQMDIFEEMANREIPSAVTLESSWNGGIDDDYRLVTYARSSNGNILWSTNEDGFFNEYPIYWEYDALGNIRVVDGQAFSEIPDSEDAYVVFTGIQGATGRGEKPVLVKNIIELSDGTQVFELYWDYLANEWKVNPNLLTDEALQDIAPPGATGFDEENGVYFMDAENGKTYRDFDKEMGMWYRTDEESGKKVFYDTERKEEVSLLFDDHLWNLSPEVESVFPDQLEFQVFIDPNIQNWNKLTVALNENMDPDMAAKWEGYFSTTLIQKMIFRDLVKSQEDFSYEQWQNNGYIIQYTTVDGPQRLILKNGNVTTVHIRADYDALKEDQSNNNFTEVVGGDLGGVVIRYMVNITSDENGDTMVEIAPNQKDALQWSDKRVIEMILLGFSDALCIPDEVLIPRASSFSTEIAENHASYQYLIFTRIK